MQIVNMKITDVRPYEKNPRFNDDAVEAVANSIREFGWRAPIVVDKDMVIICGHTRLKAAKKLGLEEVPVHIASDLSPEQIQAYRIADNKTGEIAEWNYVKRKDASVSLANFKKQEPYLPFKRKYFGHGIWYRNTDIIRFILSDDNDNSSTAEAI